MWCSLRSFTEIEAYINNDHTCFFRLTSLFKYRWQRFWKYQYGKHTELWGLKTNKFYGVAHNFPRARDQSNNSFHAFLSLPFLDLNLLPVQILKSCWKEFDVAVPWQRPPAPWLADKEQVWGFWRWSICSNVSEAATKCCVMKPYSPGQNWTDFFPVWRLCWYFFPYSSKVALVTSVWMRLVYTFVFGQCCLGMKVGSSVTCICVACLH